MALPVRAKSEVNRKGDRYRLTVSKAVHVPGYHKGRGIMETRAPVRRRGEHTVNNSIEPGERLAGGYACTGADGEDEKPWVA